MKRAGGAHTRPAAVRDGDGAVGAGVAGAFAARVSPYGGRGKVLYFYLHAPVLPQFAPSSVSPSDLASVRTVPVPMAGV